MGHGFNPYHRPWYSWVKIGREQLFQPVAHHKCTSLQDWFPCLWRICLSKVKSNTNLFGVMDCSLLLWSLKLNFKYTVLVSPPFDAVALSYYYVWQIHLLVSATMIYFYICCGINWFDLIWFECQLNTTWRTHFMCHFMCRLSKCDQ